MRAVQGQAGVGTIHASHAGSGDHWIYCGGDPPLLFIENDTNNERIFGTPNAAPYVKDAINNYVVAGRHDAVNPNRTGTKAAAHYRSKVAVGATGVIRLRLNNGTAAQSFGNQFDEIIDQRRRDADAFYQAINPAGIGEDAASVLRQSYTGMLWGKQYFFLDANKWLEEHDADPLRPTSRRVRNRE